MFKIFLKKYKSLQALPQDVLLCCRWILMTSFGIPPKIKWAIIVYDLAYCSVVYIHVFGQIGAIFFTGMVKIPWGHLTSLCLRQMILRSILSAWEEKHMNVVLVISWFDGHALLAQWHSTVLYSTQIYTFCRRLRKVMLKE